MRRLRFRLVAFAQVALLAVLLGAGAVSLAEARPAYAASAGLSLSVEQPSTVPSGARPTIVLTATDQATAGTAYAASYQAVLPSGVQYIPGSTQPTGAVPLIFPNQPATGQTTVVWTDVGDIGPGAQGELTFAVDPTSARRRLLHDPVRVLQHTGTRGLGPRSTRRAAQSSPAATRGPQPRRPRPPSRRRARRPLPPRARLRHQPLPRPHRGHRRRSLRPPQIRPVRRHRARRRVPRPHPASEHQRRQAHPPPLA